MRSVSCFVLCLLLLGTIACRDRGQTIPPAVGEPVLLWRTVGTWSGRSGLQTESFLSDTGLFKVHWESRPAASAPPAHLKVVLHSAVSGRSLVTVVERDGEGQGEATVNEDPREFFLVVEAEGTNWTVRLEEGVRAAQLPRKRN